MLEGVREPDPIPSAPSTTARTPSVAASPNAPAVHVALFLVQIAFASGAIAGKLALNGEHVDPTALACIRAMAGAIAFQLARLALVRGGLRVPLRDHARFALYAILGVAVNQAFFLHGLKRASATSAGLLAATIPVFTAAVALATRQEKITRRTALGIAVASVGVLTLTGVRDVSLGNLLVTINSLAYAAYLVGVRPLLQRYGALTTIAWVFTYGALVLAPIGVMPIVHDAPTWSRNGAELVVWFIAVPTVFAYLANAWALERARPSIVAGYIYLQPLLITLTAGRVLGEVATMRIALAGGAILVGLTVIVTRRRNAHKNEAGRDRSRPASQPSSSARDDHES